MEKIIIFGIGDISQIAYFYLTQNSDYKVVAFTVDKEYITQKEYESLPVIAFEDIEVDYPNTEFKMFIPLSYTKVNQFREKKFLEAKAMGYDFISYISPNATVSKNTKIGKNCFIFEDNTIQPYVTIEDNCILWSGNHIGHHTTIRENCFIASHVVVSGGVEVGKNTFIGVNATLRDHIKIGKANVIGAGALMLGDTEDNKVYMENATEASRVPSSRLRSI
jgi:sugar O-acyltransferase (sialic acid O-acetyltransferase NeuD family)